MRVIALTLSLLFVTSCTQPVEEISGEVISCSSLQSKTISNPITLDCLDGSTGVAINSLRGPMIINVWASWCTTCKAEMGHFRSFYEKAEGKLQLIGVDVEEASIEDGREFVLKNGMTWPNLYDSDGQSRAYFGMGVPVTWFIATDGSVAYKKIGEIKSEEELITLTSEYLGIEI